MDPVRQNPIWPTCKPLQRMCSNTMQHTTTIRSSLLMFPLTPDQHHWLDVATEDEGWCSKINVRFQWISIQEWQHEHIQVQRQNTANSIWILSNSQRIFTLKFKHHATITLISDYCTLCVIHQKVTAHTCMGYKEPASVIRIWKAVGTEEGLWAISNSIYVLKYANPQVIFLQCHKVHRI